MFSLESFTLELIFVYFQKQESDLLKPTQPLPGSEQTFILIGRNVHQWRYSLDSSSMDEPLQPPNLTNPKSEKSMNIS